MAIDTPIKPFKNYDEQQARRGQITESAGGADRPLATVNGQTGHVKKWDPVTAGNLQALENAQAVNPAKRAWVVVLHPWPISVNGGRMMRETAPPAGHKLVLDGKLLIHRHRTQGEGSTEELNRDGVGVLEIPWYEPDLKPEEAGHFTAQAILPIEQAGQYAREGNSNDLWGPGVLIYDGGLPPDEMYASNMEVGLYDPHGAPLTKQKPAMVTLRGRKGPVEQMMDVPVRGKFREVLAQIDQQRMAMYLHLVNEANAQWISSEGKEKKWYTSRSTALMAQVLFKTKRIPELPPWAMESRLDAPPETKIQKCINCRSDRKDKEHYVCICGWPFDPIMAYANDQINFEHVTISALPLKELEEVYKLREEKQKRDANRAKLEAKYAAKA